MTRLSHEHRDGSIEYGREFLTHLNAHARKIAMHDAENNPQLQTLARMAEVVGALEVGLDPEKVLGKILRYGEQRAHHDFIAGRLRIDVKHVDGFKKYLIWPVNKTHELPTRAIDALALVKVWRCNEHPEFAQDEFEGYFHGWIGKEDFIAKHLLAFGSVGPELDEGTWFMKEDALITDLTRLRNEARMLDYRSKV